MRYMLLIYGNEQEHAKFTKEQFEAEMKAYDAFGDEAQKRGVLVGGEPLHPTNTATTVRVKNDRTLSTDGPFAETKEQLGGYYLLNCKDLDEAIEFAAKIPGAAIGSIEVRPIMDM